MDDPRIIETISAALVVLVLICLAVAIGDGLNRR